MNMSHNETPFEDAQYYRDEYIRNLDQHDDKTSFAVSNASSLYALGLTMYSQTYSLDSLIYNAFAVSTLDSNIGLHPEQRKILFLIQQHRGLIFSAPTSFGKTFVVFEYISREHPKNVVMIVPTLALIDEYKQKIIRQYRDKFSDYNIYLSVDPDKEYDFSKRNIFILTHDRVVDESSASIFKKIDFLVIDEVYKLQRDLSNDRILILNIAYYNMVQRSEKYVLLAPFISGVENMDKLDEELFFYSTNFSPVVNEVRTYPVLSEGDRVAYTDKILQSLPIADNTLIYFPTVVDIDSFIENTTLTFPIDGSTDIPLLKEFVTWARHEIHPQWSVIKALEKGFLVHHGQLPLGIRMLQLNLFNNSNKNAFTRLICTSTLLEGVNTNAKNIIITKPNRTYDKAFDAFDFYNLVGRTGRLYQHYLGVAHYIKGPQDPLYEKSQAVKSIEFELTDASIDMDINFGDYQSHPEFLNFLDLLGISYDDYKEQIARKHRFATVQILFKNYQSYKPELIDALYQLTVNPNQSKLRVIRALSRILGLSYNFNRNAFIINRLTYKNRQSVRDVVDATLAAYSSEAVSKVINTVIRYKSSYIEFEFYSKVSLISYFMQCDHISNELIDTLYERILRNIERIYYLNSPEKKMLKDMGIYEWDIDYIIQIIGSNFSTVSELEHMLRRYYGHFTEISIISKYVISRLING